MRRALVASVLLAVVSAGCGGYEPPAGILFGTADHNPAWSPNGTLIAFVSSRSGEGIYVVLPDGSGLRRVFRGEASSVSWSPDGRSLAFAGARGVYVVGLNGAARLLARGSFSRPVWAPDGRALAAVKEEPDLTTRIYLVQAGGGRPRPLLPPYLSRSDPRWDITAASETEPSWSPNGREVAVQAGDGKLVAVRVADGRVRSIVGVRGFGPAWSPDGKLIAFQYASELWVANADGSGGMRRVVDRDAEGVASVGGNPAWSPDSRRIVFEALYDRDSYHRRADLLWIVDATGANSRQLTTASMNSHVFEVDARP